MPEPILLSEYIDAIKNGDGTKHFEVVSGLGDAPDNAAVVYTRYIYVHKGLRDDEKMWKHQLVAQRLQTAVEAHEALLYEPDGFVVLYFRVVANEYTPEEFKMPKNVRQMFFIGWKKI